MYDIDKGLIMRKIIIVSITLLYSVLGVLKLSAQSEDAWNRHLYVKTNTVGWAMLITNVAAEIDLGKHWSFTLPIYFSAWDYFTSDIKFRTFCVQPELRYWLDKNNNGWFGGIHGGAAFYNYAKGGDWRYQDYRRETPLYGGGISIGYRKPISKNQCWFLEFSLGGGAYKLHYDIFHNEPNGRLYGDRERMFYGIDQVNVSLAYRFNLKKGGKR